jgi:N utilization substance protein A
LDSFNMTPEDAERLIMRARVAAGWIEAGPEPEAPEPEAAPYDEAAAVFGDSGRG